MRLTAKQERFAQLLFQGHTQYDAYMQVYNSKSTRNAIDVDAHKVAHAPKIILRLAELNAPIVASLQSDKKERLESLTVIERLPLDSSEISARDKIQAIQLHSKLVGDFEEAPLVDARQFIYITSEKAKEMLGKVADRRKALPGGVTSIEEADDAG